MIFDQFKLFYGKIYIVYSRKESFNLMDVFRTCNPLLGSPLTKAYRSLNHFGTLFIAFLGSTNWTVDGISIGHNEAP